VTYTNRPYQDEAVQAVLNSLHQPSWSLVEMPTGAGKSQVIKCVAQKCTHLQTLVVTPRCKLLKQLQATLPAGVGIMSAKYGNDDGSEHDLVLGTQQTLTSRTVKEPELILIDECHLLAGNSVFWQWLQLFPKAKIVGFTATPYRACEHISVLGWNTVFQISILDLVRQSYLVPPCSMATGTPAANFETNNLQKTNLLLPALLSKVKEQATTRMVVFCQDIAHAQHVALQLAQLEEASVHVVHSRMNDSDIQKQYDAFTQAKGRSWLINVTLVSIGVDIPCIDCVVILRDVSSFSLFAQMVGRGLRLFKGKTECLVFDFGGATNRFGFIDEPNFLLASAASQKGLGERDFQFKTCPCGALNLRTCRVCARCGHEFALESKLNYMSSGSPLLSKPIMVEILDDASVSKANEFSWQVSYKFRDGAIQCTEYYAYKPQAPKIGNRFLLEMVDSNKAMIRGAVH
jgi:DNA repair protein RadD